MIRLATTLICLPTLVAADVNVVTDIAPIHSITAQIMGDTGTPTLLLPPSANPHDFQFRPSDANAMQDADVVIMVGGGLTPWLGDPVAALASKAAILELMKTPDWARLEIREGHDHGHDHVHDNHAEDDHGANDDPHAWLDPAIMAHWATAIAQLLTDQDPANADAYAANLAQTITDLTALDAKLGDMSKDGAPLLWPHDGYQYFEVAYGLNAKGSIADVHAATPGPSRVSDLQDLIAQDGIACVLTDVEINGDWIDVIADGASVQTGFIDNLGANLTPGPALYPAMMTQLADTIATCTAQ